MRGQGARASYCASRRFSFPSLPLFPLPLIYAFLPAHTFCAAILTSLRQVDDESAQLGALTELCEVLSISSEDTLASFPIESSVPILVGVCPLYLNRASSTGSDPPTALVFLLCAAVPAR